MSYFDVANKIIPIMWCGMIPVIKGKTGVGKSDMMEHIARQFTKMTGMECQVITVPCALLKDGDIGGLPISDKNDDGEVVTKYAPHHKLVEAKNIVSDDEHLAILFFDEINRTEVSVKNEIMHIFLTREINGFKLPDNIMITAAMNPPEAGEDEMYQVTSLDPALTDRMFFLELTSDPTGWINWAMNSSGDFSSEFANDNLRDGYDAGADHFNRNIIDFIATYPTMLETKYDGSYDSKATPRGWAMFNKVLNYLEHYRSKNAYFYKEVHELASAKLGGNAASAFVKFLRDEKNPTLTPQQIFDPKVSADQIVKTFREKEKDSLNRQIVTINNLLDYLDKYIVDFSKTVKTNEEVRNVIPYDNFLKFTRLLFEAVNEEVCNQVIFNLAKNHDAVKNVLNNPGRNSIFNSKYMEYNRLNNEIRRLGKMS